MLKESLLKIYAIGYVAKDIEEDSMYVDIYPAESLNTHTGELNEENIVHTTTKDVEGNIVSINIDKSRLLTAKWLPLNQSNRVTPPNVCKGETVLIYNYAGIDQYYWNTMYAEPDLRKREKVTYFFSNKESIDDEEWPEHAYTLTVDTINKIVSLKTADNDGELTTYEISLDTEEGMLTIVDGKGNFIELDSADDKLHTNINKLTSFVTPKFEVINTTTELVRTLSDFVHACIIENHVGNLGIPTYQTAASKNRFKDIKRRIDSFIVGGNNK